MMECPECNYDMDFEVMEKRGACWICDQCGRTIWLHIYTAGTPLVEVYSSGT